MGDGVVSFSPSRRKRGGILAARSGRSFVRRRLASEALDHCAARPGPALGPAPSAFASGPVSSRAAAWTG